jgi:hypothetical protein
MPSEPCDGLVLEVVLEEFPHFRIVFDDQDRASVAAPFNYPVGDAVPLMFEL